MKSLNGVESLLSEKLADNQKAIKEYSEKIEEAEQAIQAANKQLSVAEAAVDVENYNQMKDSIWSAKHAKELYQKQRDKLIGEPLITRKEYQQLLAEITCIADETHKEQNDRAVDLIAELRKISDESGRTFEQTNRLMRCLQREVYKEPEGKIPNGDGTTTWSSDKRYNNPDTVHSFFYSKIKGSNLERRASESYKPEEQKAPYWG